MGSDYSQLLDPRNACGMHLVPGTRVAYSKLAVLYNITQGFFCMVFLAFTQPE